MLGALEYRSIAAHVKRALARLQTAVSYSGLFATVPAFTLVDKNGAEFIFAGGLIRLQPSLQQHVYVDLFSKTLHVLRHDVHRGGILVASVTTDATKVLRHVEYAPKFPKSRINRTLTRIASTFGSIVVALVGDSLTDGAFGTAWKDLLFNGATLPATWRVSSVGAGRLTANNYAVGGQTSHWGLMQTGRAIMGSTGNFANTQVTYGPQYISRNFPVGTIGVGESSLYRADLVIIGFGANGGTEPLVALEMAVRKLRERGIDVIIQTENFRTDNLAFQESSIKQLAQIAEQYGAELADTWSYMREAYDAGTTVFGDVVHPDGTGNQLYAAALRSVLHDWIVDGETSFSPKRVDGETTSTTTEKFHPNSAYVMFTPMATTGASAALGTAQTSFKNPAADFGGKAAGAYCTVLTAGQYAEYGCSLMGAIDIILDTTSTCTLEVYRQAGGVLVTTFSVTAAIGRVQVQEVLDLINGGGAVGVQSGSLRFLCTAGIARIVGVVTHVPAFAEIAFADMDKVGTWATEAASYAHDYVAYTDTNGDYIHIPFTGTGIHVLLSSRTASGIVDIYFDGVLVQAGLDLFSAGNFVIPVNKWADSDQYARGYGDHVLTIALNGLNGGAVAAGAANRRLTVYGAYALDAR